MNELLFLGNLGTGEIVIIAIVVLLLFGGKKIPELMKGIGKGVKNFKDGVKGLEDDIKLDDEIGATRGHHDIIKQPRHYREPGYSKNKER